MQITRFFHRFLSVGLLLVCIACTRAHDDPPAPSLASAPAPTPEFTQVLLKDKAVQENLTEKVKNYCATIDEHFKQYRWGKSHCEKLPWIHVRDSVLGHPLMWTVYGDDKAEASQIDTSLIMCGVHGDEITPVKFCFDLLDHLEQNPALYHKRRVVVAPLVNPDSFFKKLTSRTNQNGVDINRNFPTQDWRKEALKTWAQSYGKDKRRYPGPAPMTEPEVVFQVNLIKRYVPHKIISVHAPLTLLDYDGPGDKPGDKNTSGNQLLIQMSQKAQGYRIRNYPYFPGSLGNWAGKERNIPTYTLELPSTDARHHKEHWELFRGAIDSALVHNFKEGVSDSPSQENSEKPKEVDSSQASITTDNLK